MRKLVRLLDIIDSLSEWTGRVAGFLIIFTVLVMVYEVVARYGFKAPSIWGFELTIFLCGTAMIIGGAYTLRYAGHVNVDILHSRFSLRGRAILDMVTATLFFAFVGMLAWKGWEFGWGSVQNFEHTDSLWEPPVYPFKMMLPIAAWLIVLQGLAKFIRDLTMAITGREAR